MPRNVDVFGKNIPVATEDELLDFCNRAREAGGADVLEALIPSEPGNPEACLIANAMNFGCSVGPDDYYSKGSTVQDRWYDWCMHFPPSVDYERIAEIAETLDCELYPDNKRKMKLPVHIGNAAEAFDADLAFTTFNLKDPDYGSN